MELISQQSDVEGIKVKLEVVVVNKAPCRQLTPFKERSWNVRIIKPKVGKTNVELYFGYIISFYWTLRQLLCLFNAWILGTAAAAKSLQSCPTLCYPIDSSPPGSPIPGILQARTLEWVAISFSNAWKWKVKVKSLNHVRLLATPWTAAYQAPLSTGFSRQE